MNSKIPSDAADVVGVPTTGGDVDCYRTMVETSPDIILQLDLDGRIEFLNRSTPEDVLEQIRGRRVIEFVATDARAKLHAALARAAASDDLVVHEGEATIGEAAPRAFRARIRRVGPEHARKLIAYVTDVTDVHHMQRALAHAERELRHAQKMEAIGTLAGGIAHDFNNVLSVIFSYADTLKTDLPSDPSLRADLEEITRAAGRAAKLTRQLLAFGRRQELAPEQTTLNTILADTRKMLRRLLREDIELEFDISSTENPIYVDVSQMEQVLLNLLVNARDASGPGGRITIANGRSELSRHEADGLGLDPGVYSTLMVSDTGHGMDAETVTRVFEPFFTTKAEGEGTGLGLSTVFGIVKQSEGAIAVDSKPGRGTRFTIYFPVVDAAPRPVALADSNVPQAMARDQLAHVLVVEDDQTVRFAIRRMLTQAGYTVMTAADGAEGLEVARDYDGPIHVILSDIVMPGLDGPGLYVQLQVVRPASKVIFMTGYGDDADRRKLMGEIDAPVLTKPFSGDELLALVQETIAAD